MSFLASVHQRVKKDMIVRIHRKLNGKGTINVSPDQIVTPSEIIGSSFISSGFRIIKLAESLGVSPNQVKKYLKKPLGQKIFKGELLASKGVGLFSDTKNIIAPTDGVLDFLNPETGELRLTFLQKKVDLPAGVFGVVDMVDTTRGQVIIRTQVTVVYGMLGSGRVRDGILRIISKRDELVDKSFISQNLDGQILVGGSLVFTDALRSAISAGVSGIITGGINSRDYKGMAGGKLIFPKKLDNDVGISIVVCEGFGSIPIGEDIYDILRAYNGRFVSIDGNANIINLPSFDPNCIHRVKSTHLPPVTDDDLIKYNQVDELAMDLKVGYKVRVIGNSYPGEQGKIVALDQTETLMPSGIKTFMATIATRRRKIQIPVANCEIIDYSH